MKSLLAFLSGAVLAGGLVWMATRPEAPPPAEKVQPPPVLDLTPQAAPAERQREQAPERPKPKPGKPFRAPAPQTPIARPSVVTDPPPAVVARAASAQEIPAVLVSEPEPPPPPEPHRVTIEEGTVIHVVLDEDLSSEWSSPGDRFYATLDRDLVIDGFIIAERGSRVEGRVADAVRAGKVKGRASLALELTHLHTTDGQRVAIATDPFVKRGNKEAMRDAARVGGLASVGAMLGAIFGGGKGAAIGAAAGGAAGAGVVLATRGAPAEIRAETRIPFRINAPVTITERI